MFRQPDWRLSSESSLDCEDYSAQLGLSKREPMSQKHLLIFVFFLANVSRFFISPSRSRRKIWANYLLT